MNSPCDGGTCSSSAWQDGSGGSGVSGSIVGGGENSQSG